MEARIRRGRDGVHHGALRQPRKQRQEARRQLWMLHTVRSIAWHRSHFDGTTTEYGGTAPRKRRSRQHRQSLAVVPFFLVCALVSMLAHHSLGVGARFPSRGWDIGEIMRLHASSRFRVRTDSAAPSARSAAAQSARRAARRASGPGTAAWPGSRTCMHTCTTPSSRVNHKGMACFIITPVEF